jgi:hypothetical protein
VSCRIVLFSTTTLSAVRALSDIDTARGLFYSRFSLTVAPAACRSWHRRDMSWLREIAALGGFPCDLNTSSLQPNISFRACHLYPSYSDILRRTPRCISIRLVTAEAWNHSIMREMVHTASKTPLAHQVTSRTPFQPHRWLFPCPLRLSFCCTRH